jgi:hypothetical protein
MKVEAVNFKDNTCNKIVRRVCYSYYACGLRYDLLAKVKIWPFIPDMLCSNLGWDIAYPDGGIFVDVLFHQSKYDDNTAANDRFLLNPLPFIIHPSSN